MVHMNGTAAARVGFNTWDSSFLLDKKTTIMRLALAKGLQKLNLRPVLLGCLYALSAQASQLQERQERLRGMRCRPESPVKAAGMLAGNMNLAYRRIPSFLPSPNDRFPNIHSYIL